MFNSCSHHKSLGPHGRAIIEAVLTYLFPLNEVPVKWFEGIAMELIYERIIIPECVTQMLAFIYPAKTPMDAYQFAVKTYTMGVLYRNIGTAPKRDKDLEIILQNIPRLVLKYASFRCNREVPSQPPPSVTSVLPVFLLFFRFAASSKTNWRLLLGEPHG